MNTRIIMLSLCTTLALGLYSCKKDPGEGGTASIRGKVVKQVRVVLTNPATTAYTTHAADQDVFIIYGDNVSPDDRVWTNYKGEFEFINLRPGRYTVYVYSRDTTGQVGIDPRRMPIRKEIEIGKRGERVDAGTLTIYEVP